MSQDPDAPEPLRGVFSRDDLGEIRRDYGSGGEALHRKDLAADPFDQFSAWFEQAGRSGMVDPNAMSLATVSQEGKPSLRTVLLKGLDSRGLVFFTNLGSNKARDIGENPEVALLFPWLVLERQVIVRGKASPILRTEVARYFLSRPVDSQLAAWASPQSQVISARSVLEAKFQEIKQKFSKGQVPLPSFWGGFRVEPRTFEFWQGRPSRMHDRFCYRRCDQDPSGWTVERLAP